MFEHLQGNPHMKIGHDELSCPLGCLVVRFFAPARFTCDRSQRHCKVKQCVLLLQGVERMIHCLHERLAGVIQARIIGQTTGDIGQ
ncbi:hypothetical protein D3C87_1781880 [compost metagenome]